jgi:putative endonuclease
MTNQKIGNIGEKYAEKFLASQNCRIIERNFRCRHGEIELIVFDYPSREIAFVEVKARTNDRFGEPQDSVNWVKKQKILKTALYFLNSSRINYSLSWRVDVIAVKLNKQEKLVEINHFKNIFDGGS